MELSRIQKEIIKKGCPNCGTTLEIEQNVYETETLLHCPECPTDIDSDGGSIKN